MNNQLLSALDLDIGITTEDCFQSQVLKRLPFLRLSDSHCSKLSHGDWYKNWRSKTKITQQSTVHAHRRKLGQSRAMILMRGRLHHGASAPRQEWKLLQATRAAVKNRHVIGINNDAWPGSADKRHRGTVRTCESSCRP